MRTDKHIVLRILSEHAEKEDVECFLRHARQRTSQGERNNIDAVLQVSMTANRELYEEVRRENDMCEALRELMKDDLEDARTEGKAESNIEAIKSIMKNLKYTAEQAMDALEIPQQVRRGYMAKLNKNNP